MADFINGIFAKESKYGVSIGIRLEEFIAQARAKVDEKGFVNIKMNRQKADPTKYSAQFDDWKPGQPSTGGTPAYTPKKEGYKPITKSDIVQGESSDSLPF